MGDAMMYVFVEGPDDRRFFDTIIKPLLETKYTSVLVPTYRCLKIARVNAFLESIKAGNACYIFVADFDSAPCVTARKQEIRNQYASAEDDSIVVVIEEIESWYLAGLDDTGARELGVTSLPNTDDVTKEQFNDLKPGKFDSRIDFMLEILKRFSVEVANQKNESFAYFYKKHA